MTAWEALHTRFASEIILLVEETAPITRSELTTFLGGESKLVRLDLADLVEAGLVVSEEEAGRKVLRLTPLGRTVAGHLRAIKEAVQ